MNARWWRETAKLLSKYALTVYLPTLLIFGCNGLVLPVLPAYARKEFGADDATNGLVMSMLNLAGFLMDLPGGILMGVIPPQVSSVISGAFLVASGLLGGFATDLGALGAARFMQGLGQVMWMLSRTYIFSLADAEKRGKLLSAMGGSQRFSNIVGPLIGSTLAMRFGYRSVFYAISAFGAGVLAITAATARLPKPWDDAEGERPRRDRAALSDPRTLASSAPRGGAEHRPRLLRRLWWHLRDNIFDLCTIVPCCVSPRERNAAHETPATPQPITRPSSTAQHPFPSLPFPLCLTPLTLPLPFSA